MESYSLQNITPNEMKNIAGLGLVISHTKNRPAFPGSINFYRFNQPSLLIKYHNGSLGEIATKYGVEHFTPIGANQIYYSCYNQEEECNQIRSISFDGTDSLIAGEFLEKGPFNRYVNPYYYTDTKKTCFSKIRDIAAFKGGCLVLEQNRGIVILLKEDGTTKLICMGPAVPRQPVNKLLVLPNKEEFYLSYIFGIHKYTGGKLVSLIQYSSPKYNFGTCICQLQDEVLISNDSNDGIVVYNTDQNRIVNGLMSVREFHRLRIGDKMKGFHIDPFGNFIIWTEEGIFFQRDKFEIPRLVNTAIQPSSNLWNPYAVTMLQITPAAEYNAMVLLLCMERKYEEWGVPTELCHIILSMADTWEFPNKKLSYL